VNAQTENDADEFHWEHAGFKLVIQDDYLFVDLGDIGWVDMDGKDFTPEILAFIIATNPNVITKDVLVEAFNALDELEKKAKESK
jgi:hypothetical protein